ncbi:Lactonase, 7-bladed beta-propeller [Sporotomaculum syntrophicum]|uniref:Lactonase, 7-bladed beta-propeller n=1 Tax=Sporotomaculum syntrophicum TaxID=182264 RepID=A0A9D3AZ53_9FIRM|nr:YncE family protein [Sporotomaculum syntrophicum]KAF1085529.1 Lactonase, 7-bladed beta-propeller [Sporotomaculum syntrophicum]
MKRNLFVLIFALLITFALGLNIACAGESTLGIVVNNGSNNISIIDTSTDTAGAPQLDGLFNLAFDVVVTPDNKTALITNFGLGIFFIDLTNSAAPALLGSLDIPEYYEEDIALTPDGKYALISGGNTNTIVCVVDVNNRSLVSQVTMPDYGYAQAVAVAPDGKTVCVADCDLSRVYVFTLDSSTGALTYTGLVLQTGSGGINVTISPNGKTALVPNWASNSVTVLKINSPGNVVKVGDIPGMPAHPQSVAFSPDGTRAYVLSESEIAVLNVSGPDAVSDSGTRINLDTQSSSYYGVDQIAVSLDGTKAYTTSSLVGNEISVVDLNSYSVIKKIAVGNNPAGIALSNGSVPKSDKNKIKSSNKRDLSNKTSIKNKPFQPNKLNEKNKPLPYINMPLR